MATDETFRRWRNYPEAATAQMGRMGHGRGLTEEDSRKSALGEMLEIASACEWGDEPLMTARASDLDGNHWPPDLLNGFSSSQINDRDAWNLRLDGLDWIPPPMDDGTDIEWIAARSLLSEERMMIPADFALIGRVERGVETGCCVADSNGCAAGETKDAAMLSALLELIERDATGRWWYGGRKRPAIDPMMLDHGSKLAKHFHRQGRILRLFDITTDLGIPAVAALGSDRNGKGMVAGFAARGSLVDAARTALLELLQMELRLAIGRRHADAIGDLWEWLEISVEGAAPFATDASATVRFSDHRDRLTFSEIVDRLAANRIDVAAVDLTRKEFGTPVFRLVSPDLSHFKPRFGKPRLLAEDSRDLWRSYPTTPNPTFLRV